MWRTPRDRALPPRSLASARKCVRSYSPRATWKFLGPRSADFTKPEDWAVALKESVHGTIPGWYTDSEIPLRSLLEYCVVEEEDKAKADAIRPRLEAAADEPVFVVDTAKGLTAWLKAEATEEQCFHSAWSYGGVRSLLYHAGTAAKNEWNKTLGGGIFGKISRRRALRVVSTSSRCCGSGLWNHGDLDPANLPCAALAR